MGFLPFNAISTLTQKSKTNYTPPTIDWGSLDAITSQTRSITDNIFKGVKDFTSGYRKLADPIRTATRNNANRTFPPNSDFELFLYGLKGFFRANVEPQPNILMTTKVNGVNYELAMFSDESSYKFDSTINYAESDIVGRASPMYSYQNSTFVSMTLTGFIMIGSMDDETKWDKYIKSLQAMKYPVRVGNGITAPPIWTLAIFDQYLENQIVPPIKVRVNTVSFTYEKPFTINGKPIKTSVDLGLSIIVDTVDKDGQVTYTNQLTGTTFNRYFTEVAKDGGF